MHAEIPSHYAIQCSPQLLSIIFKVTDFGLKYSPFLFLLICVRLFLKLRWRCLSESNADLSAVLFASLSWAIQLFISSSSQGALLDRAVHFLIGACLSAISRNNFINILPAFLHCVQSPISHS